MDHAGEIKELIIEQGAAFEQFKQKYDGRVDSLESTLNNVEKKLNRRGAPHSEGLGGFGGNTRNLGELVIAELEENRDSLTKNGRLNLTIKAAGDPILATTVGARISLNPMAPMAGAIGIQRAIPFRTESGVQAITYPRYNAVAGAAAKQAGEGAAKAALGIDFTAVTQNAITVAGYAKASEQALNSTGELSSIINGVLTRSIGQSLDDILVQGSAAPGPVFNGIEPLAIQFTSLVYPALVDAISETISIMQMSGFAPNAVALNPADWLAIQTAKNADGDYLTGSYLGPLPVGLRGLQVTVSPSVSVGKALLMDTAFIEVLEADSLSLSIGLTNDDFIKNLLVLRAEMRVIPVFRADGAAYLVTPKAQL